MLDRVQIRYWLAEGHDGTGVTNVNDMIKGSQETDDSQAAGGDDE